MSAENSAKGYSTFEQPPPPYSDSNKNVPPYQDQPPYQGQPQYHSDQYYPVPGGAPQHSQQGQTNITVINPRPVVVCRSVVMCSKPNNYLAFSIINFLFCCWCIGLMALVYSLRVDSEYNAGRVSEAIRASIMARRLNFMGFFLGFALVVAAVIVIVVITISDADDDDYYYYNNNNNNYNN